MKILKKWEEVEHDDEWVTWDAINMEVRGKLISIKRNNREEVDSDIAYIHTSNGIKYFYLIEQFKCLRNIPLHSEVLIKYVGNDYVPQGTIKLFEIFCKLEAQEVKELF